MNLIQIFKVSLSFWPIFLIIFVFGIFKKILDTHFNKTREKQDLSVYERKPFLFDSLAERNLFKILLELYVDKYFIFTQVNYSHLIEPKTKEYYEARRLRSRIDRKSADFVFCDKEHVIPKLIIELDGPTHLQLNRQKRDEFINELTKIVGLPILHLKTSDTNKEFIKSEIEKYLKDNNK